MIPTISSLLLALSLAAEPAPTPEPVVSVASGKGIAFRSSDGSAAMTLRARIQLRESLTVAEETTSELNVRAARLLLNGHLLTPELRYQLQLAFGAADLESGALPVLDAYLDWAPLRDLQLRAGQFLVPFDRARTNAEHSQLLVDRAVPVTELNLDRDVGLTLLSPDLFGFGGRLAYFLGVFSGSGRNRTGVQPPGALWVGRLVYRPFGAFDDAIEGDVERLARPRLALGLAGAYNQNATRQRSTAGTALKYGTLDYAHAAADLVFKYSGFSLLGEVLLRRATTPSLQAVVDGQTLTEWSRSGWGWLVQAGMMLSTRFELVGRFDQLRALSPTDPSLEQLASDLGNEAGVGLNCYLNGQLLKLQADWATRFGEAAPVHLARLQLDATF